MVVTYRPEQDSTATLVDLYEWKEECTGEIDSSIEEADEDDATSPDGADNSKQNYLDDDLDDYERRLDAAICQYPDDEDADDDREADEDALYSASDTTEYFTPCGEIVAGKDPRLERAKAARWGAGDNDVYVTKEGEIVYMRYDDEHRRVLYTLFTPETDEEKEIVRLYDGILEEQEKSERRQNNNTDAFHSLSETDTAQIHQVDKYLFEHAMDCQGNKRDAYIIRPETVIVESAREDYLDDDQEEICFSVYSARDKQVDIAERDAVSAQAISNRKARMEDSVMRGMETYGVTEDNFGKYDEQTVLLRERVFSMPEETVEECMAKYQEAERTAVILDKRHKAFDASLASGYQDFEGSVHFEIISGKEATEHLIAENRELIRKISASLEQVLGSLSDERYVTVLRERDMAGRGMDEVAAAVGLSRRGTEKLRKRALEEAEEVYQEVRYA